MAHNYFDLLKLDPTAPWDPARLETALGDRRNEWKSARNSQDPAVRDAANANLANIDAIRAAMQDPATREAHRQDALRARGGQAPTAPAIPAAPPTSAAPPQPLRRADPVPFAPPAAPTPAAPNNAAANAAPAPINSDDASDWLCGRDHQNPPATTVCQEPGCGETRYVTCPNCGRTNIRAAESQCSTCRFDLRKRFRAEDALRQADEELDAGQLSLAQVALARAENDWQGAFLEPDDRVRRHKDTTQRRLQAEISVQGGQVARGSDLQPAPGIGGPMPDPMPPSQASRSDLFGIGPVNEPGKPLAPPPAPPAAAPPPDDSWQVAQAPSFPPPPATVAPSPPPARETPGVNLPPQQPIFGAPIAATQAITVAAFDGDGDAPAYTILQWPPAQAGIKYQVRYQEGTMPPQSAGEGSVVLIPPDNTTSGLSISHDPLQHFGLALSYAVFVINGNTATLHAQTYAPVILHAEVNSVEFDPRNGGAEITWEPPVDADIIDYLVYVDEKSSPTKGQQLKYTQETKLTVPLKNNVVYDVRVRCRYRDGTITPGRQIEMVTLAPPTWRINGRADVQADGSYLVTITWEGEILPNTPLAFVNYDFHMPAGRDRLMVNEMPLGVVQLDPTKYHTFQKRITTPGTYYFAAFQIYTERRIHPTTAQQANPTTLQRVFPSNTKEVTCADDLKNLTAVDMGDIIFLTWDWPKGATGARITARPHPQAPAPPPIVVSQSDYDEVGAFGLPHSMRTSLHKNMYIHVVVTYPNSDGMPQPTRGQMVYVGIRHRIYYTFSIDHSGTPFLDLEYAPPENAPPNAQIQIPKLEIHASTTGWPRNKDPQSFLYAIPSCMVGGFPVRFQLPAIPQATMAFGRPFLGDPQAAQYFELFPKPQNLNATLSLRDMQVK
jgi:hypothetical protein